MSDTESDDVKGLVRRYKWEIDEHYPFEDDNSDADEVCVDRLTGLEVVRYDLGDPANYAASHGGWSKDEWLERKGLDPDEEIEVNAVHSSVRIDPGEVERHARARERRSQREREEADAQDVLLFLGEEADAFDFERWADGEEEIIRPALARRGYTDIGFYMIEQDSFGPLIRGIVAQDKIGNRCRFFYG